MNTPAKVRAVFNELRVALGDRVPAGELLRWAAELVELMEPEDYEPQFSLREGGIPFAQWALDAAFADGGWRVLRHESEMMRNIDDFNDGPIEPGDYDDLLFRRAA